MNRVVGLGLLAFALGVGVMLAPELLPLSIDRALVYLLGIVAFIGAYRTVVARRREGIHRAETPDPEVATPMPIPGEDVNAVIGSAFEGHWYYQRSGLVEAAVAVLTRYGGLSEPEARARIEDGTWTEDPFAAAHLGEDVPPVPVVSHLRRITRFESGYATGRRRTIAEIAAIAGLSPDVEGTGGRPSLLLGVGDRVQEGPVVDEPRRRSTGHLRGVSAVALVAIGVGVLAQSAPVVLSGVVGVGFAAYARAAMLPQVDLEVERDVSDDRPDADQPVDVTLTVRNAGDRRLDDVRIVDGVPPALSVVEGSPRLGTTLGAGRATTLSYAVCARRGVHEFEPLTVLARDLAGTTEESRRVHVRTTLTCVPTLRPTAMTVPLRTSATQYAGRVQTPAGGEGVEFHSTRAYQPGDPTNRIDWNRRARTGELATLEFREERAATVVVVVDARKACYVAEAPHVPHAVDRAVDAAGSVVDSLLEAGNRVGVAAFGTDCWLAPGSGPDHRARARELLATHPAMSSTPPTGVTPSGWRDRLERRLPSTAQLFVLSPLCDAQAVRLVRTLDAAGHPAMVLSPDPTVADLPGPMLARVARRVRITDLRGAGVPVIDWLPGDPLDAALARHAGGRST